MNRSPTPGGVFRGHFVGEYCVVMEYSLRIYNPFETHSRNVRNVFILCMLHIHKPKVWFLPCKSMVFGVQKGGFYNAKRGFLKEHIGILGV